MCFEFNLFTATNSLIKEPILFKIMVNYKYIMTVKVTSIFKWSSISNTKIYKGILKMKNCLKIVEKICIIVFWILLVCSNWQFNKSIYFVLNLENYIWRSKLHPFLHDHQCHKQKFIKEFYEMKNCLKIVIKICIVVFWILLV